MILSIRKKLDCGGWKISKSKELYNFLEEIHKKLVEGLNKKKPWVLKCKVEKKIIKS